MIPAILSIASALLANWLNEASGMLSKNQRSISSLRFNSNFCYNIVHMHYLFGIGLPETVNLIARYKSV